MNKEEYKGLNKILMKILEDRKKETKALYIVLAMSAVSNILMCIATFVG